MKQQRMKRALPAILVSGAFLSMGAQAADADLLKKLEALTKEVEALKAQVAAQQKTTQQVADKVEMTESKSLGKWLSIGGDYQFRVDGMRGETQTFTDVNATFANAQSQLQAAFFSNPAAVGPQVAAFNAFAQGMTGVKTYSDALAFMPQVQAFMPALGGFAQTIPAYRPKNDTMYTHRFGLDLGAMGRRMSRSRPIASASSTAR